MSTAVSFLLWCIAWLIARSLIELRESISKAVTKICRATILFLEDGILDNSSPDGAMLLVASFECTVLFFSEGTAFLAARLLEDGAAIWQCGAYFTRKMSLRVWIMFLIRVREICPEAASTASDEAETDMKEKTYRSLRSTGERLSNFSFGSLSMAFQLPTPHCEGRM